MADQALIKKLGLKAQHRALVLNAPLGYRERIALPADGSNLSETPVGTFDFVQLFVHDRAELERDAPVALQAVRPEGMLWIAWPKRNARDKATLTRDVGWDVMDQLGWEGVALVSIDDVWSSVRYRPVQRGGDPFEAQYAGAKAALRPIYDRLSEVARALGDDVSLDVRRTYVALTRRRQFGVIQASTRTRIDLGLKLPGVEPTSRLKVAGSFGSGQVTHRVALATIDDVDVEVIEWLTRAYHGVD